MEFPALYGKRIQLTELHESGLDDFYEYSLNPLLYRHLEFEPQKCFEETKEYFQKLMRRSEVDNAHYWFITLIESRKVIGTFGVHDIDWRKKDAEISYGISPDYWGKKYFKETLSIVLDYLFVNQRFYRIFAKTSSNNIPSIKALERVGFKKEGTLRNYYLSYDGKRYDAVMLAILQPEYETLEHQG